MKQIVLTLAFGDDVMTAEAYEAFKQVQKYGDVGATASLFGRDIVGVELREADWPDLDMQLAP